jgi:hypothetical protein
MWIAKYVPTKQLLVFSDLAISVQPTSGVIQIDLAKPVQAAVLLLAQLIDLMGLFIGRVA